MAEQIICLDPGIFESEIDRALSDGFTIEGEAAGYSILFKKPTLTGTQVRLIELALTSQYQESRR